MEQRIVLFGAGGHAREVLQVIRDINSVQPTWSCSGFIVDDGFESPAIVAGLPILGNIEWLVAHPDVHVFVAVGASAARARIVARIRNRCSNPFAVLIHPRAWVGDHVRMGAGSLICAGALMTTDIVLGEHVHVNVGSTIAHDAVVGDFVTLGPGVNVAGTVHLHDGAEIGTGAAIISGCAVGDWSIVGAGSVVTGPVKPNCTVVGAPARTVKERLAGWHEA